MTPEQHARLHALAADIAAQYDINLEEAKKLFIEAIYEIDRLRANGIPSDHPMYHASTTDEATSAQD